MQCLEYRNAGAAPQAGCCRVWLLVVGGLDATLSACLSVRFLCSGREGCTICVIKYPFPSCLKWVSECARVSVSL